MKTRIAPTPSGQLHLGNVLNFVLTWLLAHKKNFEIGLRIDDGDQSRVRVEYVQSIFTFLQQLNFAWDFGPKDSKDFFEHYSQNLRTQRYLAFAKRLHAQGLAYYCECSRSKVALSALNGLYAGTCRKKNLPPGSDHSLRIFVPVGTEVALGNESYELSSLMGDFVVVGRDDRPSYQLISVLEDDEQKIDLIVRGSDLIASSGAQLFLSKQLGLKSFPQVTFFHHQLILDSKGKKLSKTQGSLVARPEDIFAFLQAKFSLPGPLTQLEHLLPWSDQIIKGLVFARASQITGLRGNCLPLKT